MVKASFLSWRGGGVREVEKETKLRGCMHAWVIKM